MTEIEARILRNQVVIMEALAVTGGNRDRLRAAILATEQLLTAETMADIQRERDQPVPEYS